MLADLYITHIFFHFVVVGINDYFAPAVENGHLMEHLRKEGYILPAVQASAAFELPLRAGDDAVITTSAKAGDTSITVKFTINRASDENQAATGEVTFVLVDDRFEPVSLPNTVHECIRVRGDA
jgi:acyl-CoA thioesterase FadM